MFIIKCNNRTVQGTKSVYYYPIGSGTYVGDLKNGEPDGKGTITYDTGQKYVGSFSHSKPNGSGTFYGANGKVLFEGEYKEGHRSNGTEYYTNGEVKFKGEFDEYGSPQNGTGKNYMGDDIYYEGEFKNGYCDGYGKIIDKDGVRYVGIFVAGLPNGEGIYYHSDHTYEKGIWKDFKLIKKTDSGKW